MLNTKTLIGIGIASFLGAFSAVLIFDLQSSEKDNISEHAKRVCDSLYFNANEYQIALNNYPSLDTKLKATLLSTINNAKAISQRGNGSLCFLESTKIHRDFSKARINFGYQEEWPVEG